MFCINPQAGCASWGTPSPTSWKCRLRRGRWLGENCAQERED